MAVDLEICERGGVGQVGGGGGGVGGTFRKVRRSRKCCPGSLLLLALVIKYRDPKQNVRDSLVLLNAVHNVLPAF